jgi:hypothetical protein
MSYINWKSAKAKSLPEAFWLTKEHGKAKNNLSVARMAELMGLDDESILYKWIKHATMPINKIASFEHINGANYISVYLASSDNKLLINIPTGKSVSEVDILQMQVSFNDAVAHLIRFAQGKESVEETTAALITSMTDMAFHRENVKKTAAPEFDFGVAR